jgi:hypothetical protein
MRWDILAICFLVLLLPPRKSDFVMNSTPSPLALPRPGSPLWFEQIEETSTKTPDGTLEVKVLKNRIYRDSAGRVLSQGEIPADNNSTGTSYLDLMDPVNRIRVVLLPVERAGYRLPLPKSEDVHFVFHSENPLVSTQGWTTTTENLGLRIIDGIKFEGTRFRQASNDGSNVMNTTEQWYSQDLKLLQSIVTSCRGRTRTTRISKVHREEPDPALFIVPADYNIIDPK